jgi:hypothetical protein
MSTQVHALCDPQPKKRKRCVPDSQLWTSEQETMALFVKTEFLPTHNTAFFPHKPKPRWETTVCPESFADPEAWDKAQEDFIAYLETLVWNQSRFPRPDTPFWVEIVGPQEEECPVGSKVFKAYEEFRLDGRENSLMAVAHGIVTQEQMCYIMQHYAALSKLYK